MEKPLETAVRTAVTFLETHGYRYALIGGLALTQWGVVRATYDVDLKVLVPQHDYAAMSLTLRAAFPDDEPAPRPPHPLIVSVRIQQVIIDFSGRFDHSEGGRRTPKRLAGCGSVALRTMGPIR